MATPGVQGNLVLPAGTMNSSPPRHLVTVWNPSYAAAAMDAHLAILLEWTQRRERDEVPPDEVYVWWSKLRSTNRSGPLPHAAEVLACSSVGQRPRAIR